MQINIQKWGNSLGLRIPSFISKKLDLHPGSEVELKLEDDHISIYPKRYRLKDLLAEITSENLHTVEMDEVSEGNEEW